MNLLNRSLYIIASFFSIIVLAEPPQLNTEPDFYERPGSIDGRAYETSENLVVDTFSGSLSFQSIDVNIPGTGPALQVIRNYNSVPTLVAPNLGIHYGSLIGDYWCSSDDKLAIKTERLFYVDQNMTRHQVMVNTGHFIDNNGNRVYDEQSDYKPEHITMNFMRAECREQQLVITDKQDNDYYFSTEYHYRGLVTKIEDSYHNNIEIKYELIDAYYRPVNVKASDGREIKFNYDAFRIDSVEAIGTIASDLSSNILVDYVYEGPNGRLSKVVLPEGLTWEYEYKYPTHLISRVKTPLGADVTFTWDNYYFHERDYPYVTKKCVENNCWNFSYTRSISSNQDDQSTVQTPWGTTKVYSYYSPLGVKSNEIWKVGLLKSKSVFSNNLEGEVDRIYSNTNNTWDYVTVANKYRTATFGMKTYQESSYKKPILIKQNIQERGRTYTSIINSMTATGQPIEKTYKGNSVKTVNYSYGNYGEKGGRWLLGLLSTKKTEISYIVSGSVLSKSDKSKVNTYNNQKQEDFLHDLIITYTNEGSVKTKSSRGIKTTYEYDSKGNIYSEENAESVKTYYLDYYRGIPRTVKYADSTSVTNVVDSLGRVTSSIDQNGTPISYEYDDLNRIVKVTTPISNDIVIDYPSFREKIYRRGNLTQKYKVNKHGKLIELTKQDGDNGKIITAYYSYNKRNKLSFKSYEGEEGKGLNYYYDAFGFHYKTVTTDDVVVVKKVYDGEDVSIIDGENNVTKLWHYTFFPGDKLIKKIDAPEGVSIDIERNKIGLKTVVKQDGIVRDYDYNNRGLLNYYNEPEEDGHYTYAYDLNEVVN